MNLRDPVEGEAGIRQGDRVGLYTSCVRVSLDTGQVQGFIFFPIRVLSSCIEQLMYLHYLVNLSTL